MELDFTKGVRMTNEPTLVMPSVQISGMPNKEIYLYPRRDGPKKELVAGDQMVSYREHLSRNNRMIFLTGEITIGDEACNLLMALSSISNDPLKMVITSPGGYLDSTYMLCDTMKACMTKTPIYSLGRYVASAAVLPFVCCSKRYLLPHAKVMLHLVWARMEGEYKQIEIQKQEMVKTQDQMIEFLRQHGVKKAATDILKDIDRELWMDAREAIKYGLADEILTPDVMREWLS
jgi:ATP-dependent Clp protease protease subunit